MRTLRKTGVTALTAGIALALGFTPAVIVAGGATSGDGDMTTLAPAASPAGTLTLSTTSEKGLVTWNGQRQEFAESKQCEIAVSGDSANLLDISGSVGDDPGTAGFRGGSIGVFEFTDGSGPSNASQCFRVDADSTTPSEELNVVDHHPKLAALLTGLGLPGIKPEAALNHCRTTLRQILRNQLALLAPGLEIHVGRLLVGRPGVVPIRAIHCETQRTDRSPFRRHSQLRIPGQISDQKDFVQIGHWG